MFEYEEIPLQVSSISIPKPPVVTGRKGYTLADLPY
jgi:hypothetical protein